MVDGDYGTRLCLSCGLCCDGSLFAHAPLRQDEIVYAHECGLTVIGGDSRPAIQLPCPRFGRDGRCEIFSQGRPAVCGQFRCHLLERLTAGRVTFAEATERVRVAKLLRDELLGGLPGASPSLYGRFWELKRPEGASNRRTAPPDAVAGAVVFSAFVRIEFVGEGEPSQISASAEDVEKTAFALAQARFVARRDETAAAAAPITSP